MGRRDMGRFCRIRFGAVIGRVVGAVAGLAVLAGLSGAAAQPLPEVFLGIWEGVEDNPAACRMDQPSDMRIRIDPKTIDLHETACRFLSVQPVYPGEPSSPIRLALTCSGEGETWRANQLWRVQSVAGEPLLIRVQTDRKRETILIYRRCKGSAPGPAGMERDKQAVAKTQVAAKAEQPVAGSFPKPVAGLPLRRGFYVASDTPCNRASNATLSLLRRNAISVARELCSFSRIEQTGASIYRVVEQCRELTQGGAPETRTVTYEVSGDAAFHIRSAAGRVYSARLCAQSSLPQPWRGNDIRDLIR